MRKQKNENMMNPDLARKMALHLCMQNVARYLDCLNGVVNTYAEILPKDFVSEVRKDFAIYSEKMTAEGLPFKDIKKLGDPC